MKRSRLDRMLQILTALQSAHHYAVPDLAKMFGVSRRTTFRDLKDLQKAGVACHYDKKAGCYIIDTKFLLPPLNLSTHEALVLLLLLHKAKNVTHLPFEESALQAALKIEKALPGKIERFLNTNLKNIFIKGGPHIPMCLLDEIFVHLMEAILRKRVVNIHYYLPREQKSTVVDLSPYHLIYNDHTWYVLGKPDLHKRVCAFKLNRIKQLNTLDKCFTEDKEFDIHEYLGKAWSMIPEGRLYDVKLRFLAEVAHDVADVQWHGTQRVSFEDDGSAIVEFRVDGLNEITWWILSYGSRVQVLAPKILRQKIIEIAQKVVKLNA
jgi:predicted DNA-binding transcriptional regulator YafY